MQIQVPVTMSDHAFDDLAQAIKRSDQQKALLVADEHTYPACGWMVAERLNQHGIPLVEMILSGQPQVAPDEKHIVPVLEAIHGQEPALVAVGSGTITDIVRFVAFQVRLPFYVIPTAASVDAYTSYTAAITIGQVKKSILAKPASGVFAHLPTLCSAPPRLAAAGFGDMLAKTTGLADWSLAHLLVDESYDEEAAGQAAQALAACLEQAGAIRGATPAGITALMDSLFISGHCMVAVKSSRPAAGAEHSLAHFWEIQHQLASRPDALHGEKTGVASVIIAGLYAALRQLSRDETARRLERFQMPEPEVEMARVQAAYGAIGGLVVAGQASLLGTLRGKLDLIKERLLARWDEVLTIAASVPPPSELAALLKRAGSLSRPEEIRVSPEEVDLSIQNAMYVRDRFTILELNRILNLSAV